MKKKYQIFISSTFNDLKEERQMAIDTIMKLRHIPAGMELFSATGEKQLEMIKPIIYESDYYLLILAGKYGSINTDTGISYTEMEYDYAVKNNKRIIAFVHDDPDNLPSHLREDKDKMRRKLEKFRKKVMNEKMVNMWHERKDLYQSISVSISNVIEMYPAPTCWIHVNENDIYTPINNYVEMSDELSIINNSLCGTYVNDMQQSAIINEYLSDRKGVNLKINIPSDTDNYLVDQFAGCYIRTDSCNRDWTSYVLNDYYMSVKYKLHSDEKINMWIEIKSQTVELYKKLIELECREDIEVKILLKDFLNDIDDWKKVKEVCFVFRPMDKRINCSIDIMDITLKK